MGYNNAYSTYRNMSVKTASGGKLIVMLYEEALKQLKLAIQKFGDDGKVKAKDIETFGKCIAKTHDIINELQLSLNMDDGGSVAQNLMSLYIFFNKELLAISIDRNKERLTTLFGMIADLKDSWQVIANVKTQTVEQATPSLNIQG